MWEQQKEVKDEWKTHCARPRHRNEGFFFVPHIRRITIVNNFLILFQDLRAMGCLAATLNTAPPIDLLALHETSSSNVVDINSAHFFFVFSLFS